MHGHAFLLKLGFATLQYIHWISMSALLNLSILLDIFCHRWIGHFKLLLNLSCAAECETDECSSPLYMVVSQSIWDLGILGCIWGSHRHWCEKKVLKADLIVSFACSNGRVLLVKTTNWSRDKICRAETKIGSLYTAICISLSILLNWSLLKCCWIGQVLLNMNFESVDNFSTLFCTAQASNASQSVKCYVVTITKVFSRTNTDVLVLV